MTDADFVDSMDGITDRQPEHGGMIRIPGGTFRMGSDRHYPEEAPVHRVTVDGFWMDRTPVTNRQFKEFVKATGHVTFAELAPEQRFGILPKGRILQSPCPAASTFYLQLIEPDASVLDVENDERLQRIGLGCADVLAAVAAHLENANAGT